ncbi:transposase [Vibrio coralliilyticus ATCC BAA-450]|nr:transposase [Vibrio coralliilyticus ATCC BAA-450]QFT36175.1 Transposase DDE domain protein [Vibrio sp. THAF64]QGM34075.1 Transposase DDE domain protein [Vibrio sp. THAF191d]QGN69577.1 Transposase DDE domain protein [Vibrio sp. THAF191c]
MSKPKYRAKNWPQYNQSLINRGSLTFWIDETAIKQWNHQTKQPKRGRPRLFSDIAITTALMMKRVFSMPLRALQGFINSVFQLAKVPLVCPHYTCISKRAKSVDVSFRAKTRGIIKHLAIDATGLKEWKVKKHGTDGKRRTWRKLHLAVDADTHDIVAAELSLSNVTDAEVLPTLLKQTYRKIIEISAGGAYDTRDCYNAIRVKQAVPLIPPPELMPLTGKGITHVILPLRVRSYMAPTNIGKRSMATTSVRCQRQRCIDLKNYWVTL